MKFWAVPGLRELGDCFLISRPIAWIGAGFLVIASLVRRRERDQSIDAVDLPFPLHESVAAVGLFLLPLIAMALTPLTGALNFRYVLPSAVGASFLCGMGIDRLGRRTPAIGLLFIVCMTAIYGYRTAGSLHYWRADSQPPVSALLQTVAQSPLPVVFGNPFVFLEEYARGNAALNSHFWYVSDTEQAKRFGAETTGDLGLLMLGKWVRLPVDSPGQFLNANHSFELVVLTGDPGWLLPYLRQQGARIEFEGRDELEQIYHVETNPR